VGQGEIIEGAGGGGGWGGGGRGGVRAGGGGMGGGVACRRAGAGGGGGGRIGYSTFVGRWGPSYFYRADEFPMKWRKLAESLYGMGKAGPRGWNFLLLWEVGDIKLDRVGKSSQGGTP